MNIEKDDFENDDAIPNESEAAKPKNQTAFIIGSAEGKQS